MWKIKSNLLYILVLFLFVNCTQKGLIFSVNNNAVQEEPFIGGDPIKDGKLGPSEQFNFSLEPFKEVAVNSLVKTREYNYSAEESVEVNIDQEAFIYVNNRNLGNNATLEKGDEFYFEGKSGANPNQTVRYNISFGEKQVIFSIKTKNKVADVSPSLFENQNNIIPSRSTLSPKVVLSHINDGTTFSLDSEESFFIKNDVFQNNKQVQFNRNDTIQINTNTLNKNKARYTVNYKYNNKEHSYDIQTINDKTAIRHIRVLQNNNLSNSFTVAWNPLKNLDKNNYKLHYATEDFGTDLKLYTNVVPISKTTTYKTIISYFYVLNNLKENTRYYFVISEKGSAEKRFWVKTTPQNFTTSRPLSVAMGSDSRNNRGARQNANKLVALLRPDAVWFAGDFTRVGSATEWQNWFADWYHNIVTYDGQFIPIVVARGNHEVNNAFLENYFNIPAVNYYFVDYGRNFLRHYALNSETSVLGNQDAWVKRQIGSQASKDKVWRTAMYHKPTVPHTRSKKDRVDQYETWAQYFNDSDFRLVLEGDAHTMKTTYNVVPTSRRYNSTKFKRVNSGGTVYTGEGCWGAPLRSSSKIYPWTRISGKFNQFKWALIYPDNIQLRTVIVGDSSKVKKRKDADRFLVPNDIRFFEVDSSKNTSINIQK